LSECNPARFVLHQSLKVGRPRFPMPEAFSLPVIQVKTTVGVDFRISQEYP
jgi:hypothetical protein